MMFIIFLRVSPEIGILVVQLQNTHMYSFSWCTVLFAEVPSKSKDNDYQILCFIVPFCLLFVIVILVS